MFYSHTFLARKGPLGTVWLAAHLQHKLKKSHYTSTHIPSTVERIMFPEVPIALRMSGHLLLGVVRIYSKKVDYLHHDCNSLWVSLRNAFRPVDVNLQENASQAQFNAVTLPETYQLDAFDIDLTLSLDDSAPDNHLRSQEEITITDSYGGELYVRITVDDDITPDLSRSRVSPHGEVDPMQIDNPPQEPLTGSRANENGDSGPSRQSEGRHGRFGEGGSLPDIAYEYEVLRDYRGDQDQNVLVEELIRQEQNTPPPKDTPQNEADTPLLEPISAHPVLSSPSSLHAHTGPSSPPIDISPGAFDFLANIPSPELKVRSTPHPEKSSDVRLNITPPELTVPSISPPEKPLSPRRQTPPPEQPQQRRRRKRQFFDESLVLTNQFLKNALNDPSDLVKKRKKLPCSALEMWRFRNSRKKEHIFSETLISGLCAELQSVSNKDMISVKAQLLSSGNIQPEARVAESPARITDTMEFERLRSPGHDAGHNFSHEFRPSPQVTPQQSQQNVQTSSSPSIDSGSDRGMFTRSVGLRLETPVLNFEEQIDGSNAAISGIPELRGSAELDDLSFLEQDNTPPDSQGPLGSNLVSVRTKTVEQYLINHSPLSKSSDSPPEELSLKSILEGRSRKLCARMFYEILVLKSHKVIDVKQDEPYGDITLKLTGKSSTLNQV